MNIKKLIILFPGKLLLYGLLLLLLCTGFFPVNAIAVTWSGLGADNLASTPDNWIGDVSPLVGDDVVFDNTSIKDCSWDIDIVIASLSVSSGYTGTVELISNLSVMGDVTISDGRFNQNNNNIIIGVSPPTATTDPASSTNGNAVTLYATVNPNGLDTTVYFECGPDTSYGTSTTPISIGNGTSNVAVTDTLTGLSADTTYHCRVVVTNAAGTSYGSDVSFTTPSITLTVISPINNDTVNSPEVMVRGIVANTTGNETGVTINGSVATVYNGEFYINHVPLQDGQNTITINAFDASDNTASHSILVNAVMTGPYVTLRANIESGTAPLTTYYSISASIPNPVTTYDLDYEGDSTIDYTGSTFDDISFIYQAEGVYYPTITVTDDQGITYTNVISIIVLNQNYIDTLLQGRWTGMITALGNQDINGALAYFDTNSQAAYMAQFTDMSSILDIIRNEMGQIQLVGIKNKTSEYEIIVTRNSVTYSFHLLFVKDAAGLWKIKRF